ncbi:cytochrome P450 4C1-like isoform X2 [Monomorium pharaonis]|uniref:cytochrome P450 4C1-like isoform X2 n=1 Tax=Monomorium pharaonis TaxID=307658 RepID=UPI001746271A|nr:cytochrome P450 4C1-like isoform X2 [Monomorium pharaonis]
MFIIILLLVFVYFVYYMQYGSNKHLINKIPGPPGYPIIGNILLGLRSREDIWKILFNLSNQYYPIFKVWAFFITMVSIRHPNDLEIILNNTKHINKGLIYDKLSPWLGTGLLLSTGSKWQSRRKLLTPTFHFNILKQFTKILIEESESMTKSLKNAGGVITIDLIPFLSEHTLNIICETAMGTSLQGMGSVQQQYRKAVHRMGELFVYRILRPWLYNDWIFSLTPKGREQRKILKILHGFTKKIIAERKVYHKHHGQYLRNLSEGTVDAETIEMEKKQLAILDLLILASQEGLLTDSDIREEVDVFILGGYDTTSVAMSFTLSLLAEHKDIQDCVRREVDAIMQESQGKLTMKSLQDLKYLERCIKESLRLYPSLYFIARVTSEKIQLNSYLIPAKTIVHLNIRDVHRDPNFWPNPEIFDPDRFLPENCQNRHPYSYIPFSAGPRNCLD